LVVGGGSFIGRTLLRRLPEDVSVVATARDPAREAAAQNMPSANVRWVNLQLDDDASFAGLPQRVGTIVHTAAASELSSAAEIVRTNVRGMETLLAYAARARAERFVFTSSMALYGTISTPVVDPTTPPVDPDVYGTSKLMGEQLLAGRGKEFASLSVRLPAVVGPGASRHWLARICARARAGEDIEIFNPDGPFNNAVPVTALADFVAKLCRNGFAVSGPVTVASSEPTTIRTAVQTIIDGTGSRSKIVVRPTSRRTFTIDFSSAEKLGFVPVPILDALGAYAAHA
jgi:UDP-glucose 4-epimerase